MQGSVRKRGATYSYRVDIGADPRTGKRQRVERGGFRTKRAAQRALREALNELDTGTYVEHSTQPLADYLGEWLKTERLRLRPGAYDARELHVRAYITPRLGDVPLKALTRRTIRLAYAELRESGRVRGRGGLSAKTVHNVHRTLSRALDDAVADRLIAANPAKGVHSAPRSPVQATWSAEQLRRFLTHVEDDRLYALWRLAATTGLRRGELVGLRWSDVNIDRRHLTVTQQRAKGHGTVSSGPTKTQKSRRRVALDAETITAVRRHRELHDAERVAWGAAYEPHGLVFCRENGQPLHPDSVTKRMRRIARALGLPWIKFHGLRHSYATLLLEAGVHPKVVQERLGHSAISVTLDVYSHVIPSLHEEAADLGAALLDGSSDGSEEGHGEAEEQSDE